MLMSQALIISTRGTCSRAQVGAIITREGRPISTGYNGAPAGLAHCEHGGEEKGCEVAVHAEMNAIAFAARFGVGTENAALYCTHEPCANCAKLIINAGISEVYYLEPYRLHDGLHLLETAGVHVGQLQRSGEKIDL